MDCVKCGQKLEYAGELPGGDFPVAVDSKSVKVCVNSQCDRFGLLTIASRQDIF